MRWLGLFRNKTFRKHLKLIFPHWDFIISIVSLEIFHPYFVIRIFPSAFFYPPSAIRHPPPSGPHFTETPEKSFSPCFTNKLRSQTQSSGGSQRIGGNNKLVKENAAASNKPINFRETIIMAISEIGYDSLSPLIIIVIF